jgi:hypothetical protein
VSSGPAKLLKLHLCVFSTHTRFRQNTGHSPQAAINRFIAETNQMPKPFSWTANPDKIIATVKRGHQVMASVR